MTARDPIKAAADAILTKLPDWVVERCDDAAWDQWSPDESPSAFTGHALAEFLAIIEERAGPVKYLLDDGRFVSLAELLEGRADDMG